MLARLLLCKPRLIVADEPVSMVDSSYRAVILSMLMKLKTEHKINILYITHDVATAYQISDKLIVLYKGRVVEAGDTKTVIGNPKHPYTESLISSIPLPDRIHSWDTESVVTKHGLVNETGCEYTDHCKHAVPQCQRDVPSLRRSSNNHLVACRLFENLPAVQPSDMAKTV
jgi:peptide/nickel transport system ATP-binding protein